MTRYLNKVVKEESVPQKPKFYATIDAIFEQHGGKQYSFFNTGKGLVIFQLGGEGRNRWSDLIPWFTLYEECYDALTKEFGSITIKAQGWLPKYKEV